MTAETLKPSEVLDRAAALVEPEGKWMQGAFAADGEGNTTEEGPIEVDAVVCMCLFGAVNIASGRMPDTDDPERPEEAYIARAIDLLPRAAARLIAVWNDDPERTQAEVVAALRKAADLARSEGR